MENVNGYIELTAKLIEILAVVLMVGLIAAGTVKWLFFSPGGLKRFYRHYRTELGKALLVGLELLVAADIIRTVALDASLENIAILAALVVVRTVLGWTVTVETEGRWPWQKPFETGPGTDAEERAGAAAGPLEQAGGQTNTTQGEE